MNKKILVGVLTIASIGSAVAQEGAAHEAEPSVLPSINDADASVPTVAPAAPATDLPAGIVTEQNPLKLAALEESKLERAVFRPGPNMPEITNEDLLRGQLKPGEKPANVSGVVGYLPKLRVLPCEKGCEGKDYERAVAAFVKGYRGEAGLFRERGEMVVQVRWFNYRPFLMRGLPYGADYFGVSFVMEGKLVSIGRSTGVGSHSTAVDVAGTLGARFGFDMAFTLGMGARPTFLNPLRSEVLQAASNGITAVQGVLGGEDTRSRVEPASLAQATLLPPIDGILPGEVRAITAPYLAQSLLN